MFEHTKVWNNRRLASYVLYRENSGIVSASKWAVWKTLKWLCSPKDSARLTAQTAQSLPSWGESGHSGEASGQVLIHLWPETQHSLWQGVLRYSTNGLKTVIRAEDPFEGSCVCTTPVKNSSNNDFVSFTLIPPNHLPKYLQQLLRSGVHDVIRTCMNN